MSNLKPSIIYFGTPEFAVLPLQALINQGFDIRAVVTQPDRRAGRGKKIHFPEVKQCALKNNIDVLQPEKLGSKFIESLSDIDADIFVVCAFGRILSQKLISLPKKIINIHASLLPKYRGAAPIHAAIKNGDAKTGVSIMKIVRELDAGAVMLTLETTIEENDDLASLTQRVSKLGAQAMLEAFTLMENQKDQWIEQDHEQSTYAHKIEPSQALIQWSAKQQTLFDFIRSFSPSPGAYTFIHDEKVKIISCRKGNLEQGLKPGSIHKTKKSMSIAAKDGWIDITFLQLPGKKVQSISEFLNGYRKELIQCG